jgi:hypothetical protein
MDGNVAAGPLGQLSGAGIAIVAVAAFVVVAAVLAGVAILTARIINRNDRREIAALRQRIEDLEGRSLRTNPGLKGKVGEVSEPRPGGLVTMAVWFVIAVFAGFLVQYLAHPSPISHIVRVWTWNDADWWRGFVWAGVFAIVFGLFGMRDPHRKTKVVVPVGENAPAQARNVPVA